MVSLLKEQENFLRNAILTVDHSKEVFQCFIEQHLKNNHQTFEDFLNQNQHDIYHLYYDAKCCQCGPGLLQRKKKVLSASQMELLFDKNRQLSVHKMTRHNDFCCCYAKKSVTTAVLDLTLARCLLMNCCIDMFWYSCLDFKGVTLEQFLNSNRHILYHLWKSNNKCCKCQSDIKSPCNAPVIMENEWKKMFSATLPPCENDRKRPGCGTISICAFAATPSITVQQIHIELQNIIIQYCCSTRNSVEKLAELRNSTFGHVKNTSMSCAEFNTFMGEAEDAILDLATVCGKEDYYRQRLLDLRDKPLDARMFRQYERVLLQTISNYEDIIKENEVLNDGIESLKNANEEMKEKIENIEKLCILQTEGPKRKRLIDQTFAEIETHEKDVAYVEIEAVRQCIKLLESRNVVVLSGREGSGKSKNGLEILRQLKEKNKDFDVFKLIGLTYVSDFVKRKKSNVTSIVLFDDAFDKNCEQFSNDKHILDELYPYITLNKVKIIFTMRNTVKHACQILFSTHKLFHDLVNIDLNSEKFKLTMKEKKNILSRYCDVNKIMISDMKEDDSDQSVSSEAERDDNEAIRSVPDEAAVVLKREIMDEIIETDPFLGFPECCRLFTENRNNTHLYASCFKWPSNVLVNDIENLRLEGKDKYMIGLKYVILIYILTLGKSDYRTTICAIAKKDINAETCKQIYNVCYNMDMEVRKSDIAHACKVLTGCYLVNKDETYCFQHKAIQDSVIISYSKINIKTIIPLLRSNHMEDLIRLHNYTEQEDDLVIIISKQNYHDFAKQIIALMKMKCSYGDFTFFCRLMKSAIFRGNNTHLIYELFLSINEEYDTLISGEYHITHYLQLYLLSHMGKLDDKRLIVKNTKYKMLISVFIGDQHFTFTIGPTMALRVALTLKDKHIAEWLLQNIDHSTFEFAFVLKTLDFCSVLDYLQLLAEKVNFALVDVTELFQNLFYVICYYETISNKTCGKHAVDWLMDNVDNDLIDYNECLENFMLECNIEDHSDLKLLLHIIKKVDHKRIDINKIADLCCFSGCSVIIEWALQNFDHRVLDRERLMKKAIDYFEEHKKQYGGHNRTAYMMEKVVEVIILETPEIKRFNIDRLVDMANKGRWYRVLELIIKDISDIPMNVNKIIENAFQQWDNDEHEDYEECDLVDEEHDKNMTNYDEHMKDILGLIMKHYFDRVDVKKLVLKTAFRVGLHGIVKLVLLNEFDYISYLLNTTLDKLRSQQNIDGSVRFDRGSGKKLLPLIKTVNLNLIDLDSLMNDLCDIGHSSAVMWLLENKPSYRFSMKYIMNKACFRGDLPLVLYLFKNFSAEDFDYKTAMIKACRSKEKKTLAVCKWLWENIDRGLFDMKAALNNACKYDRFEVVEWILEDVDTGLYDIQVALICACENGTGDVFTTYIGANTYIYSYTYLNITKLLYERADKLSLDINAAFSAACKNYKNDIVYWIIEKCDQNINRTETTNGNKNLVKSLDKTFLDMDQAIACIFDMDVPEQIQRYVNKSKIELLLRILKQSDLNVFDIYKVLTETCKQDLLEIFQMLLDRIDHACLNIGEVINIACRDGAFKIVKWSLENINIQLLDADNVMVESCGFGWLDCLVLIWKHCYKSTLQAAMTEACTYGRLHIAKWLLQNFYLQCFNLPLILKETGRNGWTHILSWIVTNFHVNNSEIQIATKEALVNGNLEIIELVLLLFGIDAFDLSTLSKEEFDDLKNENVVNFILRHFDPRGLDLDTIMINACTFGWKSILWFIIDNDSNCSCDSALSLIDISSFITGKHVNCLCDFTSAFNTACDNGEAEIVQLLIVNVNHKIFAVQKAMLSVCIKGWDKIAVLLLDNFEHTRLDIGNALIEACRSGEIDVVQTILQKVKHNLLDIKTALNEACENHMHEELVLWILKNTDHEQLDLKNVRRKAVRQNWRTIQLAMLEVDAEGLNQDKLETETEYVVIP